MTKAIAFDEFAGRKFGRLTAIAAPSAKKWLFRCDCGTEKEIDRYIVFSGGTQSCGCLHKERTSAASITHGHSRGGKVSPEFASYRAMMSRCYYPKNVRYDRYGGRGIKVCDRWRSAFPLFLEDMGRKPSPKHSLERMDNDADYSPGNCRWATSSEQARNRSTNHIVRLRGEDITVAEAAERLGISYAQLHKRIYKAR